jgi:hypothetical protein
MGILTLPGIEQAPSNVPMDTEAKGVPWRVFLGWEEAPFLQEVELIRFLLERSFQGSHEGKPLSQKEGIPRSPRTIGKAPDYSAT